MSLEQKLKRKQKQLTSSGILKPNGQKQRKQEKGKETSTPEFEVSLVGQQKFSMVNGKWVEQPVDDGFRYNGQSSGFYAKEAREILNEIAPTKEEFQPDVQKYIDYMNEELKPNGEMRYGNTAVLVFMDREGNELERLDVNDFRLKLEGDKLKDAKKGARLISGIFAGAVAQAEVNTNALRRLIRDVQEREKEAYLRERESRKRKPYDSYIDNKLLADFNAHMRHMEMLDARKKPKPDPFKRKRWER